MSGHFTWFGAKRFRLFLKRPARLHKLWQVLARHEGATTLLDVMDKGLADEV